MTGNNDSRAAVQGPLAVVQVKVRVRIKVEETRSTQCAFFMPVTPSQKVIGRQSVLPPYSLVSPQAHVRENTPSLMHMQKVLQIC